MKQLKIRLPFALAKLTQQNHFEMVKRLLGVVESINYVKNISQDLLRQIGKCVCILSFWYLMAVAANCTSMRWKQVAGSSSS
jgi:hypothetical protein